MLYITRKGLRWGALFCFMVVALWGGAVFAETHAIGIISHFKILGPALDGFKNGMKQLGYIEGQSIRYIYGEPGEGVFENVDVQVSKMIAEGVDIFFTRGGVLTAHVIKAVHGKNIPIVFSATSLPVEYGLVKSISRPGGNVTGTRLPLTAPKTIEWLLEISPGTQKVFILYNPDDTVSKLFLAALRERIVGIEIEMVCREVHTVEEARTTIENLPEDISAALRIPSPTLDPRNSELSEAAIKRGIPMVSCLPLDDAVLLTFHGDVFRAGEKSARLAHQILHGAKPSDLPVETSECILTVNLDTAKKIGLSIPDEILLQAEKIIR